MWWAIGIAAAVALVFIVVKFRSAKQQIELTTILRNHMSVSFRSMNIMDREIDGRVWSDPYLLGYAQGASNIVMMLFGKKLSTVQKGMIMINALKELVGDRYSEVSERIFSLSQKRDPEFTRGQGHGADVMALIFNQAGPELLADPEVQSAMRDAPAHRAVSDEIFGDSTKSTGPLADAGGVLMTTYMRRHKAEAGY